MGDWPGGRRSWLSWSWLSPNIESRLQGFDDIGEQLPDSARDVLLPVCSCEAGRALYSEWRWLSECTTSLLEILTELNEGVAFVDLAANDTCVRAGKLSGSMTVMQALWHPLRQDGPRSALMERCLCALCPATRPFMQPHACVARAAEDARTKSSLAKNQAAAGPSA